MLIALLTACAIDAGATPPAASTLPVPDGFWERWGDGQAEVSGYRLVTPRYGELRDGEAVWVFVTETFTDADRVKSDGGHRDTFPVMKLNDHRSFQTGIYDYDLQTSAWAHVGAGPIGRPAKVSMAMIEWCGQVYEQLIPRGGKALYTGHSYFDGEADRAFDLGWRDGGVHGDLMPILARGIVADWPPLDTPTRVPWLPTLVDGRIQHVAPAWGEATLTREGATADVEVPAGVFAARRFVVAAPEGRTTYWIEAAAPHRVLRWERDNGEVGELTGTTRVAYWSRNSNADEGLRDVLGLSRQGPR